ncbi:hypothetical protein RRG08_008933 [Elysia crispata]|uniref:Uncharacterized protein n=1 Tax=Elysia crispata TaxID=231223 RepID=A0AAE0YAC4_9GAST|nr:hypothetical protein RRG08_008933 [Elysia crispata]
MKHNRPSSGELAKELFSPRSMLKTKRLLEKALESKKSGSSSSNLYVPDTCNSLNPNDSRDFKDAPRLRKVKLRLKLKSDSNSDKEHQGSSENAPAYDKAQRDRTSSNSSSLVVKKEPGYAESTIDDIDTKDIFTRNLCIKSDNEDQSPVDNGGNSNSNTLWNSSAQTSQVSSIDIVPSESNTTSNSTNRSTCCVCRSCIPSISYEEHLRSCLRERFTKQSGTGPCPAKKNEKQCNICHEAIGHLNSRAQNKHVNNCLDKSEDQKQKENEHKQQLAEAREAVPACPLCAQNFKSHQARKNHLKKCAKDKGMTVDRLKLLMKQQEED